LGNEVAWDNRASPPRCGVREDAALSFRDLVRNISGRLACEADVTFVGDADGGIESRGAH
jgi:hypothetical protein